MCWALLAIGTVPLGWVLALAVIRHLGPHHSTAFGLPSLKSGSFKQLLCQWGERVCLGTQQFCYAVSLRVMACGDGH